MDNAYPEHAIEGVPEDDTELVPDDEQADLVDGSDELDESNGNAGNVALSPVQTIEHQETASRDLEELVRYVASKLVHSDEDITVESEFRGGTVYLSLKVPEEEMGRVIGREGRTAKAIRTLVSIAGARHNVHARLDIDG